MQQYQNKFLITQQKFAMNYVDIIESKGYLKAAYIDHSISGDKESDGYAIQLLKREVEPEDVLLVYDNDRLGRTAHDIENAKDELLKKNVKTITLDDNLSNDTVAGRILGGVKSVFAQRQKEAIRERTENDMGQMLREGTLKTCPYGYRSKLDPTDPKGCKKIDKYYSIMSLLMGATLLLTHSRKSIDFPLLCLKSISQFMSYVAFGFFS